MVVLVDSLAVSYQELALSCRDIRTLVVRTAEFLGQEFDCSRVVALIHPSQKELVSTVPQPIEWSREETDPIYDQALIALVKRLAKLTEKLPYALHLSSLDGIEPNQELLEDLDLRSTLIITSRSTTENSARKGLASLILFHDSSQAAWNEDIHVFLEVVAPIFADRLIALAPANLQPTHSQTKLGKQSVSDRMGEPSERLYRRLVENSDAIIFSTDAENIITFISRRALDFFGIVPEDFISGITVEWFDLVHLDDRERIRKKALSLESQSAGFEDEFRVINHITGRERWLLTKLVPVRESNGTICGWDGFGVDITARREAQEALDTQSKKVRALYTVSAAIRGYLDPANIAARGLTALTEATGATSGLCYLYPSSRSERLELVAHHGFSAAFAEQVQQNPNTPTLLRTVAENAQSVVVSDLQTDPRAKHLLSEEEGARSAVVVPISAEDEVFGTLALFHPHVSKFDGGDVMLVAAAANQIGLAARQAHLFSAYRKQTKNLSALYRMSHELSPLLSLEEIFQQAFTIIRDELGLKRLWLGLLNEGGTRLIGQAAYGPGWKRRLVEMNVELTPEGNPITEVVLSKSALIVEDPDKVLGQLGLKRFFSRFAISSLALAPLLARGQILGILAVEPGSRELSLDDEEMTLLSSLANEIASLILTKRLEERIAEGEKMRTAGLLAAGVAHNFNNLLQAVLGQASLLEMQRKNETQVLRAAKIISESAQKGAGLVKQLISFANLEEAHLVSMNINEALQQEMKHFSSLMPETLQLKLSLRSDVPNAFVDTRHLARIVQSLLSNAIEAMQGKGGVIQIFTDFVSSDKDILHVEVPAGRYVRVGVRDSGIGMDAETKRRCFEPFFTTKNVDPSSGLSLTGAGLGLAAAYALARKNGGRLVVDSRLGQGSVFTFYIPVDKPIQKKNDAFPTVSTTDTSNALTQSIEVESISLPSHTDSPKSDKPEEPFQS